MSAKPTTHTLPAESELRLEVPPNTTVLITLKSGSAEIFGAELPPDRPVPLSSSKVAIFTWHGATIEVSDEDSLDILYVSEETEANVAYVNTHAQLEAMRDEALGGLLPTNPQSGAGVNTNNNNNTTEVEGPRVLLVGPSDCGKSSIARILSSYAVKLSRLPILIDLDVSQNMLSVPGTIAASPLSVECISAESNATSSILNCGSGSAGMPLVLWYGSEDLSANNNNSELYTAQIDKLAESVDARLSKDVDARSSGIIVNTSGWIEGKGYEYILHVMEALRINVVLVVGHDRLYSMLGTLLKKKKGKEEEALASMTDAEKLMYKKVLIPKLIKLPRSGGVVSRDVGFRRALRMSSIHRYFYGKSNKSSTKPSTNTASAAATTTQYQFTPSLLEVSFSEVHIHKLSNISLSASMLPVSAKQSTDPIQLVTIPSSEITTKLQQCILAVCHPSAVEKYEQSGVARDLYLAGVAGFVAVEKVDVGKERLSLLSPCVGSLPSCHLLLGDVSWLE
jgi:polyribonucleotide 5'-hydroxyl-kinase